MTVIDTHQIFSKMSSMTLCVLVLIKEPDEIYYSRYRGIREENSIFESIPENIRL
jgi:hypothetical protein